MRTLEEIDQEIANLKEARRRAEGTPAEVYSRIVGYYRSVRNWNKGKREEYDERRLYLTPAPVSCAAKPAKPALTVIAPTAGVTGAALARKAPASDFAAKPATVSLSIVSGSARAPASAPRADARRILLFVRPACPNCPPVKDAAGRLGIPVDLVNTDTEDGLAEAARRNVLSTPTAILLADNGAELDRARDSGSIAAFGKRLA